MPQILGGGYFNGTDKLFLWFDSGEICKEGLVDYKFYCFNGEPQYLYVSQGLEKHETAYISFLTLDWKFAPFGRNDFKPLEQLPSKPFHYEEMLVCAGKLSQGHDFLRVDLYEINNHVYFLSLLFHRVGG